MFDKILIANRGEIACRVIKTARKMGIKTVAVYSAADKDALHVALADEALPVGPAPSNESYLVIDKIIEACRQSGAEAVHPGYGFLSEKAKFAERLDEAGIVFIGPGVHAIRSMGDKITSKRLAIEAGVNTIPGYTDVIESADHAVAIAGEIGYPVMLKASAGGGGKGMRIARNDEECRDGFERATGEARSAFGDERVFLERFVEQPRHIEIQVMADRHGNIIHLFERECSLQRRHQKIIEESPSPLLDDATRTAMGQQAVALAHAVDYQSAGTVEFIVDANRHFYFLEMNTRLQVEHPVTEFVTGLDLVEWMIRIAAGEALPFSQADVKQLGWAIETRIYAEDPLRNFLPSVGRLVRYIPPAESENVRVDTGVCEGDEVSIYYDPMIAKLITAGATREEAITHMRRALNQFYLSGVSHNISFLAALVEHERFRSGRLTTNMISQEYPEGFRPADEVHDKPSLLIAVAATIHRRYMDRAASISGQMPGYEREVQRDWVVVLGGEQHAVEILPLNDGSSHDVNYNGENYRVLSDWEFGQPLFHGTVNGSEVNMMLERRNMTYRLFHWGAQVDAMVLTAKAAELLACMPKKEPPDMSRFLLSPMPGLLSQLMVDAGHKVKRGQDLAVVEAMKMENVLRAERDGMVSKSLATVGDTLAVDQPILEFESAGLHAE
ncbi:MAG: acetyl/propionyl/methylcrotonyl-CoA carboxylase subunit alpha [Pirellulales bacterium]|nr:acetyl/propionyl/methylcrotonyl-CoA carboxylase subunit alpha [Pirellulales bacterium]